MFGLAPRLILTRTLPVFLLALLLVGLVRLQHPVYGDQLPTRSIAFGQAAPGVTDVFKISFTIPKPETLGSLRFQLCAESPLVGQPCTLPTGMVISTANLSAQSGITDFSVSSISGSDIILSRTPGAVVPISVSYTFNNITDANAPGSYFARIQTYASNNATGSSIDYGGLAYALTDAVSVNATVPPYLYFCLGITISGVDCTTADGNYINFGDFSPSVASVASTQMVAGTNADTGYTISANGVTLTSGNNVLPNLVTPDTSRPGTSQFGMNLVANQDPVVGQNPSGLGSGAPVTGYNQANLYKFVPGDVVAGVNLPDEARKYTTSYVANVAKTQAAGVYVSTLTYVALAGF